MNKKVLISCLLMVFIFISSVSAAEYNGTTQNSLDENNIAFILSVSDTEDTDNSSDDLVEDNIQLNESNINDNQNDCQPITNRFIKNNNNLIFKDISNQKDFFNNDDYLNMTFPDNVRANANYALFWGWDNLTNKSYFYVDEIQTRTNQMNSVLIAYDVCLFYKNGKYSVYLKDESDNPLSNEMIIITINGVSYTRITDSNGYASLNINLNPGNYSVNALFLGNNLYKSSFVENNVYVVSTILAHDLVKSYKNDSQFNVMLFDSEGNRLKNTNATFNINGVFYNRTTDKTGVAKLNINLNPGEYIITVTNNNDGLSLSYTVTVIKQSVYLNYSDFIINRAGEYFVVNVMDSSNKALSNFDINFCVNGVTYVRTSDNNGIARLKINFPTAKDYPIYCSFSGTFQYNAYNGPTKIITRVDSSTKLNVNLNTQNILLRDTGYTFDAALKDNNNFAMPNQNIIFQINGVSHTIMTDENGIAKLNINLPHGQYSISTTYAGSTYYNSIIKNNIITVNLTPNLVYNVNIPMYFNVSGLNYVNPNSLLPEYIAKSGENGIIKVYETREIVITTSQTFAFVYGQASPAYSNNYTKLSDGDNYFISKTGQKISVNQNYVPTVQGILLKTEKDYVKIYYYDTINENNINGFSVAYSSLYRNGFDLQAISFIKNFNQWGEVLYSNSMYNDDAGLKIQLANGNVYYNGIFFYNVTYNQFLNGNLNLLNYTNTNSPLHYTLETDRIDKNPDFEYMDTELIINNEIIEKTEKINTGVFVDVQAGFNTIQTFTIADRKISNEDIDYWLNKNYTMGISKASYGTFLNGLMTMYMSDNLANEKDDFYNLTWTRNENTVVMSGVMNGGVSYIHVPNPSMNMILSSNNDTNMKNFRFECSIMLSDMENIVLGLSGLDTISSCSALFSHLFNESWFRITQQNQILNLSLKDYPEMLLINQTSGIVSIITNIDGFIYKGAVSYDYSYCFCDGLTDNTQDGGKKVYEILLVNDSQTDLNHRFNDDQNFLGLSEDEWDEVARIAGGFFTSASYIVLTNSYCNGGFVVLGIGLGVAGFICNYYANDMDQGFSYRKLGKTLGDTGLGFFCEWANIPMG